MNILLSDGRRLHGAEDCWEIHERKQRVARKDGEGGVAKGERYEAWTAVKWLSPDLESAVRFCAEMEFRTAKTLKDGKDRIDRLAAAITSLYQPLSPSTHPSGKGNGDTPPHPAHTVL